MIDRITNLLIGVICFCFIVLLESCGFSESEMIGLYAPVNYTKTFDTIQLQSQGRYNRRVYDKSRRLVLEMNGRWTVKQDVIDFKSPYFFNLDRDVSQFPELLNDTLSNGSGYVDRKNGTILFCVGYYENENCYQKLK